MIKPTFLRLARLEKGLSQMDVVLKTDIPQCKFSLIERDYVQPSPQEAQRLAKALGIKN
jgi:transcriptional regulator with XRE-family HTH domain